MYEVKALSIDHHFRNIVQTTSPITIHSVFARTINIIIENNMYTIASRQLDNAPATLMVDLESFSPYDFLLGDPIALSNRIMNLSSYLSIDLNTADFWRSELPDYPGQVHQLYCNLLFAKIYIVEEGKAEWLRESKNEQTPFHKEMQRMLLERTTSLINNFTIDSSVEQLKKAKQLIGLGQGLTPSGDDFLTGMLLAFSTVKGNQFNKNSWSLHVVKEAKEKTNFISYSTLKYAANGEARETIGSLFQVLFNKKEADVEQELKKVMQIGSSSGTEILWGIINGLLLFIKQEDHNDNTNKD